MLHMSPSVGIHVKRTGFRHNYMRYYFTICATYIVSFTRTSIDDYFILSSKRFLTCTRKRAYTRGGSSR